MKPLSAGLSHTLRIAIPVLLIVGGFYGLSQYNYLLFHTLVEFFSVVVAASVFLIAWNTRDLNPNSMFLLLGIAYLFVGLVDGVHALAYKGMAIFPGYGANLPTQLWIAGRYLESLSLLAAFAAIGRRLRMRWALAGYSGLFGLILVTTFGGYFPDCYLEGQGLTVFKIVSEYLIVGLLAGAFGLLVQRRQAFAPAIFRLMAVSILLTMGAELAFTFYISVYGLSNLIGHLFKLFSFYLIYRAIIATGLREPYALVFRDLAQKSDALQRSEARFRRLAEHAPAIIYRYQLAPSPGFDYINPQVTQVTGYSPEDHYADPGLGRKLIHPDDQSRLEALLQQPDIAPDTSLTLRWIHRRGDLIWTEHYLVPIYDDRDTLVELEGIAIDVTARKQAEAQLNAALTEKDLLMREILHRTKNNMASISALLTLQEARINEPQVSEIFQEINSRVNAMLLVQQQLYQTENFNNIDLGEYLEDLAYTLFRNLEISTGRIALHIDLASVTVSADAAIPCGLILNELMTNALKYAFPDEREGELRITLRPLGDADLELRVSDDGVGLPAECDPLTTDTLGLSLVASFAQQLRGTLTIRRDPGAAFTVRFPQQ
jgi:PAS domain S-box-containing protein